MHFYWRILEELKYLGETWELNDPSLKRCYHEWVKKNNESFDISFMDSPLKYESGLNYTKLLYSLN